MTTRRDILTGLAAVPLAASLPALPAQAMTTSEKLKAFYDECAAEVSPAATGEQAAEPFRRAIDADIWQELEAVERHVANAKAALLKANVESPTLREAWLLDQRISMAHIEHSTQWASGLLGRQRRETIAEFAVEVIGTGST